MAPAAMRRNENAGATWILGCGGSIRDQETIDCWRKDTWDWQWQLRNKIGIASVVHFSYLPLDTRNPPKPCFASSLLKSASLYARTRLIFPSFIITFLILFLKQVKIHYLYNNINYIIKFNSLNFFYIHFKIIRNKSVLYIYWYKCITLVLVVYVTLFFKKKNYIFIENFMREYLIYN